MLPRFATLTGMRSQGLFARLAVGEQGDFKVECPQLLNANVTIIKDNIFMVSIPLF